MDTKVHVKYIVKGSIKREGVGVVAGGTFKREQVKYNDGGALAC